MPQVTMLAEELRKRGMDIPKGILHREELVQYIMKAQKKTHRNGETNVNKTGTYKLYLQSR